MSGFVTMGAVMLDRDPDTFELWFLPRRHWITGHVYSHLMEEMDISEWEVDA